MLILFTTLIILGIGTYSIRLAVLSFVFLLPFLSRGLSLAVGGLAFTPQRACIIALMLLFSIHFMSSNLLRKKIYSRIAINKVFMLLLLTLIGVKFLSTLINSGVGALAYVVDDMLFSLFFFVLVLAYLRPKEDEKNVVLALVIGVFFCSILVIIEQLKGDPLLSGLVDTQLDLGKSLVVRERDGYQRSQALFDNPLLLSEFACISFPFILYAISVFKKGMKAIAYLALFCIPFLLFMSYARSGILVLVMEGGAFLLAVLWSKSSVSFRLVVAFVSISVMFLMVASAYVVVTKPEVYFDKSDEKGDSAIERATQYLIVADVVRRNPILGLGLTQNFIKELDLLNHLDSYWLRLLLEGGLLALLLFSGLTILMLKLSLRKLKQIEFKQDKMFFSVMLSFFVSFLLYKFFLSMPVNNIYFYLVAALFFLHDYEDESFVLPRMQQFQSV